MKQAARIIVPLMLLSVAAFGISRSWDPNKQIPLTPAAPEDFVSGGPPGGEASDIVIDRSVPPVVYAQTGTGIAKLVNGYEWQPSNNGLPLFYFGSLAADPTRPGTAYLETLGRIYKTTDTGQSWKLADAGLPPANLPAVDPTNPNTIYTRTHKGLFKSIDGGETWRYVGSVRIPERDLEYRALLDRMGRGESCEQSSLFGSCDVVVDRRNSSILYAGTDLGVIKSHHAGATWSPAADSGLQNREIQQIFMASDSTLYAVSNKSIFMSLNGGQSWNAAIAGETSFPLKTFIVDPTNPLVLYAATDTQIYKSVGHNAWELIASGFVDLDSLAVDPSNPAIVYAGTSVGAFRSTDGGRSWETLNSGLKGVSVSSLAVLHSDRKSLFTVTGDGSALKVIRSDDGAQHWTQVGSLPGKYLEAFTADLAKRHMIFARVRGVDLKNSGVHGSIDHLRYGSIDGGLTWTAIVPETSADQSLPQLDLKDPSVICTLLPDGLLYSTDGGKEWTLFAPKISRSESARIVWVDPENIQTSFAVDGTFPPYGLYRTTNGGRTWSDGVELPLLNYPILFDSSARGALYATEGNIIGGGGGFLRKSDDAGVSWVPTDNMKLPTGFLRLVQAKSALLFAGVYDYGNDQHRLLKTTDGGRSWTAVDAGLSRELEPTELIADPDNSSILYLAIRQRGIFKSTDGGNTWSPTPAQW